MGTESGSEGPGILCQMRSQWSALEAFGGKQRLDWAGKGGWRDGGRGARLATDAPGPRAGESIRPPSAGGGDEQVRGRAKTQRVALLSLFLLLQLLPASPWTA